MLKVLAARPSVAESVLAYASLGRYVAAELFISPRTLEPNLARIYRKLGIHSRAELGQLIGRSGR